MVEKNFICVIEARMGSKRFPGKSLKKLDKSNNLIDYVIKNVLESKYFNNKNIYLLTSELQNNKPLIEYVKKNYLINLIIGSEENVFSRYLKFKKKKNFPILRLTGDNPFIDPILIDEFVEIFVKKKFII
jgi:spore coat polysaccharide biosynthesis protein SpsF